MIADQHVTYFEQLWNDPETFKNFADVVMANIAVLLSPIWATKNGWDYGWLDRAGLYDFVSDLRAVELAGTGKPGVCAQNLIKNLKTAQPIV